LPSTPFMALQISRYILRSSQQWQRRLELHPFLLSITD
jgi:hypothetical protein